MVTNHLLSSMQLLKTLNCNVENPYLIWDNRTRAELTKYLEEQQQSIIRTVRLSLAFYIRGIANCICLKFSPCVYTDTYIPFTCATLL